LKTKRKTYVLLILVVVVWATIGYKVVSALNTDVPEVRLNNFVTNTNFKIDTKIDTFSIHTVNRDPFLGTLKKKELKKKVGTKKIVQWKPISYQGTIKQNRQQIFIVTINGAQHLLKKGQTKDSITLTYGDSKSVTMRYKKQSKTFTLKK
jgi:hypothetical protein